MRRLLASVATAALVGAFLVSAPTAAQAAPPTSTWTGGAGGDTAGVDLDVAGGLQLAGARLAVSQADSGSQRTPNRSTARSANLGATVATLPISVLANQEVAGPAVADNSSSPGLAASSALGVGVGAIQTSDRAVWGGDNACVLNGTPLARASTQTAGVSLAALGLGLLTTGTSTTTGTTELTPIGNGGFRNGVRSTATGAIANVNVLGAQIGIAGTPSLRTTATGSAGGGAVDYTPAAVTLTPVGGTARTVALGGTDTTTINLAGGLQRATVSVGVNNPTTSVAANGTSASASVAVVTVTVRVFVILTDATVLTSTIDVLPLRSTATAPVGGIDCPAPAPAAPVVTTPADGSRTNDTTPTYSGTGVAGASLNLTVDGARQAAVTTVGNDGTWTYTPTATLAAGSHTVSATQTLFGTESNPSSTTTFVVDLVAPAAPVLTTPANGSVTNDRTPTYTGTAEPGASVTVYEGTTARGTGTANASGNFSFPSSQLAPGSHTVFARATDEAGNVSLDSDANTFLIDTVAPAPPVITVPTAGTTTTDTTPTISGTAEANAAVRVLVDGNSVGTTTANGAGAWTLDSTTLGQGAHTATAVATDAAGNASDPSAGVAFTVDSVAPAAPVILTPANGSSTDDTTPDITGTAEANASVRVLVDGTSVGTTTASGTGAFSLTPTTPLTPGQHTATAVATDAVGNVGPVSAGSTFTVDVAAPDAPVLTAPANGSVTDDTTPTYVGTAERLSSVTVFEGPTAVGTGQANAQGAFSIVSDTLTPGLHTVVARATDAAGNVSASSNSTTFTVDVVAPAPPVITTPVNGTTTSDTTPTIAGTSEAKAAVEVFVDGASVGTTTASATGEWTLESATTLGQGPHTATAVATDAAGNFSLPSNTVAFTVDSVLPAAPVVTAPTEGSTVATATPTITGTAEANASVQVFIDNAPVGTTTAGVTGGWTLPAPALVDGPHTVRAVATDAGGNVSPPSATVDFVVDTTAPAAPVITEPTEGQATSDTTPTISGTAEADATVDVYVDGLPVGTTTANGAGFWTLDSSPLGQGPHTVRAEATDAVGNESLPSDPVGFSVDSQVPDAPVITTPTDGSSVSDLTPTISGTSEANADVEVFVDGASVGTTTANAQGAWTLDSSALPAGPHTATAVATDAAGNESDPSDAVGFTIDVTVPDPPVITTPTAGSSTSDTTPTISGTAEADADVEVFVDGLTVGTTTANAQGAWTLESSVLTGGPHTATAVATDAAGNDSLPSAGVTFTVDTIAPVAPVITVPGNGDSVGDTTPTISGTSEPNVDVEVFVDGDSMGTTTADGDGNWSLVSTPLGQGDHTATAVATDAAGNDSPASDGVDFSIDVDAPAAPVIAVPTNGSSVSDTTPTISGTSEPNVDVEVFVDGDSVGTTTADDGGNWSLVSTPLGQGDHTATAVATDAAGNPSQPSVPVTFTVDTAAPAAPVLTTPADGSVTNDTTPTYTGTAEAGTTVRVYEGTTLVGTGTATTGGTFSIVSDTLTAGSHTVSVRATDTGGNVSVRSNANTFRIDTTAPAAPVITTPVDGGSTTDPTPTITGTAEPGATVVVTIDGNALPPVVASPGGTFSVTPTTPLGEGEHTATAAATDPAGNPSPVSDPVTFVVDTLAPTAPVIVVPADESFVTDTTPTISGTAEANSTVRVRVDGRLVGTTTANGSGAWTLDSSPLTQGRHTATSTSTDAAGNVSVVSNAVDFTVDTVAPTAPVITVPTDGSSTSDTSPTISGTSQPDVSVEVFVDGVSVGTTTASGTGTWTLDSTLLTEGDHTATAVATDPAGNVSGTSNAVDFTVDATAPDAPVILVPVDGSTTADATPTISGTAEPNVAVEVFVDGESAGTTTADGNGAWSLVSTPLGDGPHTATAVATDAAGNESGPSGGVDFTVAAPPAAPVITVPTDGSSTKDTTPTISGTAQPGSSVEVFVDGVSVGTTTAGPTGAWTLDSTVLTEGEHTVTAVATDEEGPSETSNAVDVTIDTTAPAAPVVVTPADGSTTNDTTPTISGTAEPGATVEVFVDGESLGTVTAGDDGSWTITAPTLAVGEHQVDAVATDDAGNVSLDSNTNTFTVVADDGGNGTGPGNGNNGGGGNGTGSNSGSGNGAGNHGGLASTGGPSLAIGLAALLLLLGGGVTLLVSRRRRG